MATSKAKAAEAETVADPQAEAPQEAVTGTDAAPLEAPVEQPVRVDVGPRGAAPNAAAPHAPANDTTTRLLDETGHEVSVEDLFDYPTPERPGTVATVRQRVYREYTHPGATTKVRQLLYPAGALVSIFEAERVKAEHRARNTEA